MALSPGDLEDRHLIISRAPFRGFWLVSRKLSLLQTCVLHEGVGFSTAGGAGVFSCRILLSVSPACHRGWWHARACSQRQGLWPFYWPVFHPSAPRAQGEASGFGEATPLSKLTAAERAGDLGGERRDPPALWSRQVPI